MDNELLLSQLEELAKRLGILVRDENDVSRTGGVMELGKNGFINKHVI